MLRLDVPDDFEMLIQNFYNLVRGRFQAGFSPFLLFGWYNFFSFCLDLVYRTYKVSGTHWCEKIVEKNTWQCVLCSF